MRAMRRMSSAGCALPLTVAVVGHCHAFAHLSSPRSPLLPLTKRTYYTASRACLRKSRRSFRVSPVPLGTPLDDSVRAAARAKSASQEVTTDTSPNKDAADSSSGEVSDVSVKKGLEGTASLSRVEKPAASSSRAQGSPSTHPPPATGSPSTSATATNSEPKGEGAQASNQEGASEPSTPPPSPPDDAGPQKEHSFLQRMFASWQQGVVASIGAAMGVGFLIYVLYAPVKEDTVHHTAMVASEALADLRIKKQAVSLSKDVVANVLRDPQSVQLVSQLVVTLLAQEETKVAISSLLQSLFEDHYTQEVTKKFVLMVVRDPWIEDQIQSIVKEQVLRLLEDDEIKLALSQFLLDSASDSLARPDLHYTAARAARSAIGRFFNPWWTV